MVLPTSNYAISNANSRLFFFFWVLVLLYMVGISSTALEGDSKGALNLENYILQLLTSLLRHLLRIVPMRYKRESLRFVLFCWKVVSGSHSYHFVEVCIFIQSRDLFTLLILQPRHGRPIHGSQTGGLHLLNRLLYGL